MTSCLRLGLHGQGQLGHGQDQPGGRARLLRLDSSPQASGGKTYKWRLTSAHCDVPVAAAPCERET